PLHRTTSSPPSLPDALPTSRACNRRDLVGGLIDEHADPPDRFRYLRDQVPSLLHGYPPRAAREDESEQVYAQPDGDPHPFKLGVDRKSTRLNSSHQIISYAV